MLINNSDTIAELTRLHAIYEKALVENDVETLDSLFWDSEHAVRYGVGESLYGISEIRAFRNARAKVNLARTIERLEITTFDDSAAVINLDFVRAVNKIEHHGRQSQFWMKHPDGWKIVSAHVSFPFAARSYVDEAADKMALPIAACDRASVEMEFDRISSVAQTLLQFPLDQTIEAAAVFEP